MRSALSILFIFFCAQTALAGDAAVQTPPHQLRYRSPAKTSRIPAYAKQTLAYIQEHHEAPPGYEGGRRFGNHDRALPSNDLHGQRIEYQEWDVRPHVPRRNRGPERIVTGSDGSAWYTPDHYRTFIPFGEP
jgi:ribonuclease T1